MVKSICGVILAANDPKGLADFYSAALGLEFQSEDHGGLDVHYGVDIGNVHFGIHPAGNLGRDSVGSASASIAFAVESVHEVIGRLGQLGARQVAAPHDEGFGLTATYADPEGNHFEFVELSYDFGG